MKVYKFGGASVNSAEGVKRLHDIVSGEKDRLIVVVSAMGKMTNALEAVVNSYFNREPDLKKNLQKVVDFHANIIKKLFAENDTAIQQQVTKLYDKLNAILAETPSLSYDFEYDRVVSFGERLSTTIIAQYLNENACPVTFVDIRKCLITDNNYREGNIDAKLSRELCNKTMGDKSVKVYLTQGFIAGTVTNQTTTLGREGSDYSAAVLANLLNAESITIWKDVPGVMTGDPKRYKDVQIIPVLSYKETIELSYCGASIIHPKTVKPLQNKRIPMHVKSFLEPQKEGSVIVEVDHKLNLPPIFINKSNQVLLTLTPRDFSFIAEEKLSQILAALAKYRLKSSLIQSSAISFSLCIDYNKINFLKMIDDLKSEYEVLYNTDVEIITIRHYTKEAVDKLVGERTVFVEQRNRLTARFVVPC